MKKYSTIFFDWGGVIANDPGDDFLRQLLKNVGATDEQIAQIMPTYMRAFMRGQISEHEYWQQLKDNYALQIPENIAGEFTKWKGLNANQDILDLAEEARSRGLKIAILSNVMEPSYKVLRDAGHYGRFDEVIASCEVGYAKPDREIYEIALERLDATGEQCIFIDDKQRCLDPAKAMGFTTVLAQSPEQIIRDVRALL